MLEDEERFHALYVAKTEGKENIPAFDIGTYFHTGVLEPHLLKDECAIFKGIRRGMEWEKFQFKNRNKAIITEKELDQAKGLIKAVTNSPAAMEYIKNGKPEVSVFVKLFVAQGEIYAPDFKKVLKKEGWESVHYTIPSGGVEIIVKCRADVLGDDFILDLKSTGGNTKNKHQLKPKISQYSYDLSAALYMDIFNLPKKGRIKEFLWTFASKDIFNSKTWRADRTNILIGRIKWQRAVLRLAYYLVQGWEFHDSVEDIEPSFFEREHLISQDHDIL